MSKKIGTFPKWLAVMIKWGLKNIFRKKIKLYGRGSRVNCSNSHRDLSWKRADRVAVYLIK